MYDYNLMKKIKAAFKKAALKFMGRFRLFFT